MPDKIPPNFLEVMETGKANQVDLGTYRVERFSDTKNGWIFVKRRTRQTINIDDRPNLLEINKLDDANNVDLTVYRFECFSDTRGTWMFVKRRIIDN